MTALERTITGQNWKCYLMLSNMISDQAGYYYFKMKQLEWMGYETWYRKYRKYTSFPEKKTHQINQISKTFCEYKGVDLIIKICHVHCTSTEQFLSLIYQGDSKGLPLIKCPCLVLNTSVTLLLWIISIINCMSKNEAEPFKWPIYHECCWIDSHSSSPIMVKLW